jgi:5-deoxy-5-amino-3-dehydroquinate synthase
VAGNYELVTDLPPGLSAGSLVGLMGLDKKVLSAGLTFVLDGPDGVEVVPGVRPDDALAALAAMR